jgi:phage terminase small subunit
MLAVINNAAAPARRRDKMAIAAAPYCHAKPAPAGKKRQAAVAAKRAGAGTSWADDLDYQDGRLQQ